MAPRERDEVSTRLQSRVGPDPEDCGLRADQVAALVRAGYEIGFHTLRHHPFPTLDDVALKRALTEGRRALENVVDGPLTLISYPHGKADGRVAKAAREAGYLFGFTGRPERVDPDVDPLLLGRLEPSFSSTAHFALRLLRAITTRPGGRR